MASRPLIIGHRGAPGYRPEHTQAAYELAFELGADAIEPDLVATRDGVLVVRHENEISGTTDVAARREFADRRTTKRIDGKELSGWFTEDFTWDELATLRATERLPKVRSGSAAYDGQYPILRLRDVFRLVSHASINYKRLLQLVIEFKHASYFESVGLPLDELFAAELKASGWDRFGDRITLESFELRVLGQLARRGVPGERYFLVESKGRPYDLVLEKGAAAPHYADFITEVGLAVLTARDGLDAIHGVGVSAALLLGHSPQESLRRATETVRRIHSKGLKVFVWTLRPENRFLSEAFRAGGGKNAFGDWQGQFRTLMASGVDGVFADHPDLALRALCLTPET